MSAPYGAKQYQYLLQSVQATRGNMRSEGAGCEGATVQSESARCEVRESTGPRTFAPSDRTVAPRTIAPSDRTRCLTL